MNNIKLKKKTKKPNKTFVRLIILTLLIISAYLISIIYKEVNTTMLLKQELKEVLIELDRINEENLLLISHKSRFDDPNYVQSYARGNYMVSKEGEKIFFLSGPNQQEQETPIE